MESANNKDQQYVYMHAHTHPYMNVHKWKVSERTERNCKMEVIFGEQVSRAEVRQDAPFIVTVFVPRGFVCLSVFAADITYTFSVLFPCPLPPPPSPFSQQAMRIFSGALGIRFYLSLRIPTESALIKLVNIILQMKDVLQMLNIMLRM